MKLFSICVILVVAVLFTNIARAENETNTQPATAAYLNNLPQAISANVTLWYKFDYKGDKSLITLLMPNGTNSLVEFNVFTPEQAQHWWEPKTKPIGRGTAYSTNCATGEEQYWGECKSPDLKWKGEFNFPGTFFVQVVNFNTGTANFTLTIEGTGVSLGAPPSAATQTTVSPAPPQIQPMLPVTGGVWQQAPRNGFMPRRVLERWDRE